MRKEQILLLTAAAIGGLLVWSATGSYTAVGAESLPGGRSVSVVESRKPDLVGGLSKEALKGRAAWAVVRSEKRPPLPEIPSPAALPLIWVRPVPRPGPSADHWQKYRTPIVPIAKEKEPEKDKPDDGAAAAQPDPNDPNAAGAPPSAELFSNEKPFDPAKAAKLVRLNGEEVLSAFEPSGPFKGQPDWVILEKWPNVQFKWSQLDGKGKVVGTTELVGPEALTGMKTVHLRATLDNCFHEERISRGVRDNDREALVSFAQWCFDELKVKSAEDKVQFGLLAIRRAIEVLEKAKAINADADLVRKLGSYYRAAFDLDGVTRVYLEFLKAHPSESAAQLLIGEAYERMGCWANARALYEKAALTGDPEARLRVGLMLEREGEHEKAVAALKAIAGTGGVGPRASLALARLALRDGDVVAAASYADLAKKDPSPALNQLLGSLLYANGKFTEAATTFGAAKEDEVASVWRSNRALSMLAAGELDGASKECQVCLDQDPLNLLDPLYGLGESFQRKAETDRSNAYYEMALARSPKDPWILLRVATLRLRDGQAQKALDLGLQLLEVAPGCNEGLWLVGRAAASLDKPDWEKAIAYLRRARAKEHENKEFLYELARVLVLAGKVEDAIKALEEATAVQGGFAKSDGRLIGVLAWARFLGKRSMEEVNRDLARAKVAVLDETTKEWLAAVRTLLEEWDGTRIWTDDFNRPPSNNVGNGWQEQDSAHGINVGLNADKLVFASTGTGVKQAAETRQNATRVFRDDVALLDLGRVKEIEASLKGQMGVETIFHIYTTGGPLQPRGPAAAQSGRGGRGGGAELGLGCDRNGKMVLYVVGASAKSKDGNPEIHIKDAAGNDRDWPMDDDHTVRFVRKDPQRGIWEVWFDDERILGADGKPTFEIGALSKQPGRAFGMGFLVDADAGSTVEVSSEYVKVTKSNK